MSECVICFHFKQLTTNKTSDSKRKDLNIYKKNTFTPQNRFLFSWQPEMMALIFPQQTEAARSMCWVCVITLVYLWLSTFIVLQLPPVSSTSTETAFVSLKMQTNKQPLLENIIPSHRKSIHKTLKPKFKHNTTTWILWILSSNDLRDLEPLNPLANIWTALSL